MLLYGSRLAIVNFILLNLSFGLGRNFLGLWGFLVDVYVLSFFSSVLFVIVG